MIDEDKNLEVEDDRPDEAEDNGRSSVDNVSGVDVHQLDLQIEYYSQLFTLKIKKHKTHQL